VKQGAHGQLGLLQESTEARGPFLTSPPGDNFTRRGKVKNGPQEPILRSRVTTPALYKFTTQRKAYIRSAFLE
jgi:hypothetical protein